MFEKVRIWVTDRFALGPVFRHVLFRRIPKTPWYFGDGATLMLLFMTLVVTGSVMALTYTPSTHAAYQSVVHITEKQTLGWLVRALHFWAAGVMVVMLLVHMFRQILLGGYKSPREGTWILGVFIFGAIMIMAFTGYTLRWDERAVYAIKVALNMFYSIPVIGEFVVVLVQGGREISHFTLTRMYAVHVIIVPLLLFALIGFHLYLVLYHGVTTYGERKRLVRTADEQRAVYQEEAEGEATSEYFYPDTSLQSALVSFAVLCLVLGLAVFVGPPELFPVANLENISMPIEEWWFYWYSSLIAVLPEFLLPLFFFFFPLLVFLALLALPFIDRGANRGVHRRPIAIVAVIAVLGSLLYLSDLRRRSPWTGWPSDELVVLPDRIELTEQTRKGHELFTEFGCNSCHGIAGKGRRFASDLAAMEKRYGQQELEDYIARPPSGVAMPAYETRMTEEEIHAVAQFVLLIQTAFREDLR